MVATAVDPKSDEQEIRDLVDTWLKASKEKDLETLLDLLADDVIFMVVGKEPFGKKAFAEMNKGLKDVQIEGKSEIQEIKVLGDWAWMRSFLTVRFTPPAGRPATASGHILTILRRDADAGWVIARDANLLMPQSER
jgi:uncharacterized protein (TIGR02246 family)